MARKRQRRRATANTAADQQGHHSATGTITDENGVVMNIRQIHTTDEGVLYTHRIVEHRGRRRKNFFARLAHLFRRRRDHPGGEGSVRLVGSSHIMVPTRSFSNGVGGGAAASGTPFSPPPQSETLKGFHSFYGCQQRQYTIASKKKYRSKLLNWFDKHHMNIIEYFWHRHDADNNVYRPSTFLYRYIDWTFTTSFTRVFVSFLFIYFFFCLLFGGFLLAAGNVEPNCIVATGESFGSTPGTEFSDAFALSWTTFTTVGYGMTYTSTASDFGGREPHSCSLVVFLCTLEAFMGLLFAGMCAAILFGKVNRVQSHANLTFCNAVCLQYEEEAEDDIEDFGYEESERSRSEPPTPTPLPALDMEEDEESQLNVSAVPAAQDQEENKFIDQFNGCPILKFQVVNELCNREGAELVDCIMKVVGIKFKGPDGRITHSQYVRVNLVDFEHPFLSRVWHGVHILDSTSPLLTDRARQRIRENNGSWPSKWFDPDVIRRKLEFDDLIVTVAGISNVSAVTVHAYKRYKIGDVLIGYNFAPIVFRDVETGKLEVDMSMCNDVREQNGIRGEDLTMRRSEPQHFRPGFDKMKSTIRIKASKSGDALGIETSTSYHSASSKGRVPPTASPLVSPAPPNMEIREKPADDQEFNDDDTGSKEVVFRSKVSVVRDPDDRRGNGDKTD